jgi:hypothetical protein
MRVIEIDCSDWQSVKDFLTALRAAIGAPDEHGWSVNALYRFDDLGRHQSN